jgi:STE24 endopeptidase
VNIRWITDFLKSEAIATVLLTLLAGGALGLILWSPGWWWLYVWGFFAAFTSFLMYISPYVIEPMFFRFEPLKEKGLEDKRTRSGPLQSAQAYR